MSLFRLPDGDVVIPIRPGKWCGVRRRRTIPRGSSWHYFSLRGYWLVCHYRPYLGMELRHISEPKFNGAIFQKWNETERPMAMRKREALGLGGVVMPGANPVSIILGKLPSLREFVCSTKWDDDTQRVPGTMKLSTNGTVWEILLQCPSTASRIMLRGAKLDEVLMLAEQYVSAADAPWEVDRYLAEKMAEKKPRKK